jgi:EamA domain-containing membrane protein RarD
MSTLAVKRTSLSQATHFPLPFEYNKYSLLSLGFAFLFILYFLIPHSGPLSALFSLSIVYLVLLPALAFLFAVLSLRQIARTQEKGSLLSYVALGVASLYFIVALAIPFVLIGYYLVYSYVL